MKTSRCCGRYAGSRQHSSVSCAVQIAANAQMSICAALSSTEGVAYVCFGKAREIYAVQPCSGRPGCSGPGRVRKGGWRPQPNPEGVGPAERWPVAREVFRDEPFNAGSIDFPPTPIATLSNRHSRAANTRRGSEWNDAEVRLRAPKRRENQSEYSWVEEIPSETAATRLLHALGFGADRVSASMSCAAMDAPSNLFTRGLCSRC